MSPEEREWAKAARKREEKTGVKEGVEPVKTTRKKAPSAPSAARDAGETRAIGGAAAQPEPADRDLFDARSLRGMEEQAEEEGTDGAKGAPGTNKEGEEAEVGATPPPKKMPVFFLDEAHKVRSLLSSSVLAGELTALVAQLPALIQSSDAMKTFLDSQLVLTKQDRLCRMLLALPLTCCKQSA